jgi:bifunctional ADP-heptose synthase (sugar kinase/adenylyltransferase)
MTRKMRRDKWKIYSNVVHLHSNISRITVNRLNTLSKRKKIIRLDKKQNTIICSLQKLHFKFKTISRLRVKG